MSGDPNDTITIKTSWIGPGLQALTFFGVATLGGVYTFNSGDQTNVLQRLSDRVERIETTLDDELDRRRNAEQAEAARAATAEAERAKLEARMTKLEDCLRSPEKCQI